jgi:hypothetical protein
MRTCWSSAVAYNPVNVGISGPQEPATNDLIVGALGGSIERATVEENDNDLHLDLRLRQVSQANSVLLRFGLCWRSGAGSGDMLCESP